MFQTDQIRSMKPLEEYSMTDINFSEKTEELQKFGCSIIKDNVIDCAAKKIQTQIMKPYGEEFEGNAEKNCKTRKCAVYGTSQAEVAQVLLLRAGMAESFLSQMGRNNEVILTFPSEEELKQAVKVLQEDLANITISYEMCPKAGIAPKEKMPRLKQFFIEEIVKVFTEVSKLPLDPPFFPQRELYDRKSMDLMNPEMPRKLAIFEASEERKRQWGLFFL